MPHFPASKPAYETELVNTRLQKQWRVRAVLLQRAVDRKPEVNHIFVNASSLRLRITDNFI